MSGDAAARVVGFLRGRALEIGLLVLVTLLFADYLFSDRLLYGSDSIPAGLFFRGFLVEFVREFGELPKWNPYILGGLPFLDATHGDTFFPSSILHFLMPVYRAMGHKLILHIFLAGVFMAYYLRSYALHPRAVAIGAVAYMLSPIFVSYLFAGQDGKMYVTSLAPLVLGLAERGLANGRLVTFLGLGLAIGFTILSAQIQMAYHLMWFLGALFVLRLVFPRTGGAIAATAAGIVPTGPGTSGSGAGSPPRLRLGAFFALAVVIALGIASIQLFPAVSYVKHPAGFSVRSEKTDYEHASSWSLHPEEVASMVVPEFCNAPRGYWGRNVFKYNSDYPGILVLFLAVLAMVRRRDSTRWFLAGLAIFAVAYSLGEHTPLHRLFYWVVPQVKIFRAPPLVMFGAAIALAALAAFAVHDLETGTARTPEVKRAMKGAKGIKAPTGKASAGKDAKRVVRGRDDGAARILAWGLSIAVALALAGLASRGFTGFWNDFVHPGIEPAKLREQVANLASFRGGALAAAAILAAGAGLVFARARGLLPDRAIFVGLLVLVVIDLWRVDQRFRVIMDPQRFTVADALVAPLALESRKEKFRVMPALRQYAFNEMGHFRIESVLGFHDNELAWYRELRTAPAAQGLLATNARGYPFLRMLNAKYVLHDSPQHPNPLPVPESLPRFWLVGSWEVVGSRDEIAPRIAGDAFDPAEVALLEEEPGLAAAPDGAGESEATGSGPGRVAAYSYLGNEITVEVENTRPALLVHAENWFPYWHAFEGARELPILRANGTLRAIPLEPGRHAITLRFRSVPYETGKWIALVTFAGVLGAMGALGFRDRRRVA